MVAACVMVDFSVGVVKHVAQNLRAWRSKDGLLVVVRSSSHSPFSESSRRWEGGNVKKARSKSRVLDKLTFSWIRYFRTWILLILILLFCYSDHPRTSLDAKYSVTHHYNLDLPYSCKHAGFRFFKGLSLVSVC
jgi:hypothetical protein